MTTETNFEERWPDLFAPLTQAQREQAVAACWYVLNDGFPLTLEDATRITTLLVEDPEQFAILYGPYVEVKPGEPVDLDAWQKVRDRMMQQHRENMKLLEEQDYATLAEHAERGELRVKSDGINLRGDAAAAEGQRRLMEATGASSLEEVTQTVLNKIEREEDTHDGNP